MIALIINIIMELSGKRLFMNMPKQISKTLIYNNSPLEIFIESVK